MWRGFPSQESDQGWLMKHSDIKVERGVRPDQLVDGSSVGFGTSGLRGLAAEMTDRLFNAYTQAFIRHLVATGVLREGDSVALAGDLRESTPRIMAAVGKAVVDCGCHSLNCGRIPTPALACFSIKCGGSAHMRHGSWIRPPSCG
ncbi:MAG: hypothetical protein D6816_05345 [Bacteroidetes bacterium]|nr:MAG: hypothetical protein D6816_05345 [Bacteroidota bacterium]